MKSSLVVAMAIYGCMALLAALSCALLPIETKDQEMKEGLSKK